MCAPTETNVITSNMTKSNEMQKVDDLKRQLYVTARRGRPLRRNPYSSLSERRANELISDNSDHLSEMIRKNQHCLVDLDSDDESDLEEDY
ncbi:unnamed protein product [Cylindrotheca closterium]|uniref:Uncharacterized protein n=1 Tax=Cylindrotheca closterium TaxID=2856 RepID=A0AAD2JPX2_9STRA|nr:unnamed protein product [Cylindrotheca closterium]